MNFFGQGFQKFEHYKQADVAECLTMSLNKIISLRLDETETCGFIV